MLRNMYRNYQPTSSVSNTSDTTYCNFNSLTLSAYACRGKLMHVRIVGQNCIGSKGSTKLMGKIFVMVLQTNRLLLNDSKYTDKRLSAHFFHSSTFLVVPENAIPFSEKAKDTHR